MLGIIIHMAYSKIYYSGNSWIIGDRTYVYDITQNILNAAYI